VVGEGSFGDALGRRLAAFDEQDVAERLWSADATLWKADDESHQAVISQSLGWLTVHEDVRDQVEGLQEFAAEAHEEGYRHAVLLGMGGSSLAAEVMAFALGTGTGAMELTVLDTTDPAAIATVEQDLDLAATLFIVASKSGGTTETANLHAYFHDRLCALLGREEAGRHFIAITDPDTSLERQALEQGFRAVFLNPDDIGGRYSALSFFGLVPAALFGADLETLLDRADAMASACAPGRPAAENVALVMGAWLGEAALAGRDKLTILASPAIGNFGSWAEQLVAESTGKEGRGLFPVDVEPPGHVEVYGDDRAFVYVRLAHGADTEQDTLVDALEGSGHTVLRLPVEDAQDIAGQFLLWELAVAVAGHVIGIDPFDQPNVQESKDNTGAILAGSRPPATAPLLEEDGVQVFATDDLRGDVRSLRDALETLLAAVPDRGYLAVMAYLDRHAEADAAHLRRLLAGRLAHPVTFGWAPRFLHSTGQYHKGGPQTGAFLQVTAEVQQDLEVPGRDYTFGALQAAQALGDLRALGERGRPVLRVHLTDRTAGLRRLLDAAGSR
jgi:transaldolase / glucose-6-phosphate isomerase